MISIDAQGTLPSISVDLTKAMQDIADTVLVPSIAENFAQQGRPNRWPGRKGTPGGFSGPSGPLWGAMGPKLSTQYDDISATVTAGPHPQARQFHFGAEYTRPTTKQAKFFWRMFFETGDFKWKAFAILSANRKPPFSAGKITADMSHVSQPPRPYMMLQDEDVEAIKRILSDRMFTIETI